MANALAYLDESGSADWSRTLYAFLAEKERRSGSLRTVQSYSRMLNDFFGRVAKTPDEVTSQDVFGWAYGVGLSGKRAIFDHHWCQAWLRQLVLPLSESTQAPPSKKYQPLKAFFSRSESPDGI